MRARSVCGLILSRRAAPCRPSTRPLGRLERSLDVLSNDDVERRNARRRRLARSHRSGSRCPRILTECARNVERFPLTDQHRAVHHRGHFAHVARPLILGQQLHVTVRDRHRSKTEAVRRELREVLGKRSDIARPIAQRRDHDRKHREAVVEIFAKRLLFDHAGQMAVRGGHDSHVHFDRPLSADANQLGLLDHAQQADLRRECELADFVEEQRAAVGLLEPALAPGHRTGEGALLVAEQFRIDEFGRNRATVDAAERAVPERRVLVDRASDDLLAGSGLTEQQDRRGTAGHDAGPRHHRGQSGVAADQPLLARARVAGDEHGRSQSRAEQSSVSVTYDRYRLAIVTENLSYLTEIDESGSGKSNSPGNPPRSRSCLLPVRCLRSPIDVPVVPRRVGAHV